MSIRDMIEQYELQVGELFAGEEDDDNGGSISTAGIRVNNHVNAIECYGVSERWDTEEATQNAIKLRDYILNMQGSLVSQADKLGNHEELLKEVVAIFNTIIVTHVADRMVSEDTENPHKLHTWVPDVRELMRKIEDNLSSE